MENSNLTFVLMAGLPGAGKTTLARALRREHHWHLIDKDGHKEALMEQGIDEEQAGRLAYELAFYTARDELVKQHMSVIFDTSALHTFIVDDVMEIMYSIPHARLKVILCVADRDLRNDRLRNRPPQITTIRADPMTIIDYLQYYDHLPKDKLILYTNRPIEQCLTEVREYLRS